MIFAIADSKPVITEGADIIFSVRCYSWIQNPGSESIPHDGRCRCILVFLFSLFIVGLFKVIGDCFSWESWSKASKGSFLILTVLCAEVVLWPLAACHSLFLVHLSCRCHHLSRLSYRAHAVFPSSFDLLSALQKLFVTVRINSLVVTLLAPELQNSCQRKKTYVKFDMKLDCYQFYVLVGGTLHKVNRTSSSCTARWRAGVVVVPCCSFL